MAAEESEDRLDEYVHTKFHNFLHFLEEKCGESFTEACNKVPISPYNVSGAFIIATIKEVIPPIASLITARDEEHLHEHILPSFIPIFNQARAQLSEEDLLKVWRYLDLWVEISQYF